MPEIRRFTTVGVSLALVASALVGAQDRPQSGSPLSAALRYLPVAENRAEPSSRTIEVAYLPLAGRGNGVPTFVFFGGPGESVTDYETLEVLRSAHDHLLARGDVVFIEQRGVGASRPTLDCEPIRFPLDRPVTAAAVIQAHQRILPACIRAAGADMRGYTTTAIADDTEAIRETLGYDRINLSGGSYGAQQAYFYLRRYGQRVNRAVLTQFLAPGTSLALPSTIDDYVRQIGDRLGPAYGQASGGGEALQALVRAVYQRLAAEPVRIAVGDTEVTAGRTDLEIVTALALRRTRESWLLPMLFTQMEKGEFSFVGQVMLQFYRQAFPVNAAVLALDCSAQRVPGRQQRFRAEVDDAITGEGAHLPFPKVCDVFEHGTVAAEYSRSGSLHDVPTLFIQGELDARARDENLREAFAGQNVRLLVIGNATHDLGRSVSETIGGQLDDIEARFLFDAAWPEIERIEIPLALP